MNVKHKSGFSAKSCLSVIAIALVLPGCSMVINAIAERAAIVYTKKFELKINRVDPFMSCIETPGGVCPLDDLGDTARSSFFASNPYGQAVRPLTTKSAAPQVDLEDDALTPAEAGALRATLVAADLAREVLNHDVQAQLNALYSTVKGAAVEPVVDDLADDNAPSLFRTTQLESGDIDAQMNISIEAFNQYQDSIEAATLLDGWEALSRQTDLLGDVAVDSEEARRRSYIAKYFHAYFREGKFFRATIDGSQLKTKIIEKISDRLPGLSDSDYDALARGLFPQHNFDPDTSEFVFGRIEDTGFVTRAGQVLMFPAVEASLTLGDSTISKTDIDYIAVGTDLIRVLLHAIYDADMQLPAVTNATGVLVSDSPLVVNDPTITHVEPDEFERIQTRATQIEGVVSAGTGRIIRGISFLSLNNEALATAIETAIGLAVKKQMEKVMWCWYACRFDEIDDVGDFAVTSQGDSIKLTISVQGIPADQLSISGKGEFK